MRARITRMIFRNVCPSTLKAALTCILMIGYPALAGPFDSSATSYKVVTKPSRTVSATLSKLVRAPHLQADEWILVAPSPPEHPSQEVHGANLVVAGTEATAIRGEELSPTASPDPRRSQNCAPESPAARS